MNLILKNVTKTYGDHMVLDRFCHAFPANRITTIEGRSGCGKTTLLRLIAGLEAPDAGTIEGVPAGGIAMMFQEDRLPPQLTAAGCLRAVLKKTPDRDARIDGALRALGLGDALGQPVSEFSGGMRRRVALARALLYPAGLVLLDEPFKGLDAATRDCAVAFARPLLAGRTTLLVTHDQDDAGAFDAERLLLET
ncbi:MAG: ATP-binding cassette domain-containing protein [Clostridia bacterium]|nr:ATP-binding cassette domain-containing protein [Clostridia bacterium]